MVLNVACSTPTSATPVAQSAPGPGSARVPPIHSLRARPSRWPNDNIRLLAVVGFLDSDGSQTARHNPRNRRQSVRRLYWPNEPPCPLRPPGAKQEAQVGFLPASLTQRASSRYFAAGKIAESGKARSHASRTSCPTFSIHQNQFLMENGSSPRSSCKQNTTGSDRLDRGDRPVFYRSLP